MSEGNIIIKKNIIEYFIHSNMDMKVLHRDSGVLGALFYILNNSTKTELPGCRSAYIGSFCWNTSIYEMVNGVRVNK